MKTYPYTSIKVIDGNIKAVCNQHRIPNFGGIISLSRLIELWQQNHEVFEFANYNERNKTYCELVNITGSLEFDDKLKQGIEVTCIEIKDGLAYFKSEDKEDSNKRILELEAQLHKECDYNHMAENHLGNAINSWKDTCNLKDSKIKELESQINAVSCKEDEWISVKDGLPIKNEINKNDIPCLCYDNYHNQTRVLSFNVYHNCWDDEDMDDYYTDAIGGKVTHWTPLPNPPKNP